MTRPKKPKLSAGKLYDLFIRKNLLVREISERYGIPERTLYDWLAKHGISKDNPPNEWEFCKSCGHMLTNQTEIS